MVPPLHTWLKPIPESQLIPFLRSALLFRSLYLSFIGLNTIVVSYHVFIYLMSVSSANKP